MSAINCTLWSERTPATVTKIGDGSKRKAATSIGKPRLSGKAEANAHEQDLADRLGGHRQPLSGALVGHKGDIKLDHFLLDSKQTVAGSIIVSGHDLTKITREAREVRKEPALVLTIAGVPSTVSNEWVVIPLEVFSKMLIERQDEKLKDHV